MESYFGWHQDESTTREKLLIDINQRQELELNDKNNFKIQARNLRYGQSSGILNRYSEEYFLRFVALRASAAVSRLSTKSSAAILIFANCKHWINKNDGQTDLKGVKLSKYQFDECSWLIFFYSAVIRINQSNLNFYHFHLKCSISSWRQSQ